MKKSLKIFISIAVLLILNNSASAQKINKNLIDDISTQLIKKIEIFGDQFPAYTEDGKWKLRKSVNWFSGFPGGQLWYMYQLTKNDRLKQLFFDQADRLVEFAGIDNTHDMGFIFLPTVVRAYKETHNPKYRDAALLAARMLAKRFNEKGNFIRAWGKLGSPDRAGLMIIDTMMNLELLFWAAEEFGLPELYDIAYKHAVICMREHIRNDFSTHHVVEFDPETGKIAKKFTHQGFADETAWARGQAWGIYGFANAYKFTGDERFLNLSKKLADFFTAQLPDDLIPRWDLSLTDESESRDASAAAIAASGMYLLADLAGTKDDFQKYRETANKLIVELAQNYTFHSSDREEQGILLHTVYNHNKGYGVDESYPCGDFYFIEALYKYFNRSGELRIGGSSVREKININADWFYLEEGINNFNDLHLAANPWQLVDLPHTWNKFDVMDQEPGYRRDISWYQKEFDIPELPEGKRIFIEFEGVNIKSEVFVNGVSAGKHIGGYVGFNFDITSLLKKGKNRITVKADNSVDQMVIPSQLSDFFIFGGITRDVYLSFVPETFVKEVKISTPSVSAESADTEIEIAVDGSSEEEISVLCEIYDPEGVKVLSKRGTVEGPNSKIKLPNLDSPKLWSPGAPNLYTAILSLTSHDSVIDVVTEQYGYRWYTFKERSYFYLNGEKLLLRGTHRHEEWAGYGNAMPNELHRKDIEMIKEMGANFVRLAHYPQDPEIYKACDELGLLVWDELPWCRGGVGPAEWKNTAKNLFTEQINQNYNHPSIILWSVGNEVYWMPEFENGGDIDALRGFTKELHNLAHTLDPYRLTSIRKFYEGADIVDVFSPSIWAGWYSGVYKSYAKALDDAIQKYPRFFHAEYGGASHRGRHTETTITGDGLLNPDEWAEAANQTRVKNIAKIGDWSESYIVDLFDWHLRVSETQKDFTGNAQWAFKDFGTPLRPENAIPYVNQKGLVDREGNPKDAYYVYKSYWTDSPKFVYIESHTWPERYGPENSDREVNVFSNCGEVELFLNGVSQGKKKRDISKFPAMGLSWNVKFEKGSNKLSAVGGDDTQKIEDEVSLEYFNSKPGKPQKIKIEAERLSNSNFLIKAKVVDKHGRVCSDYNSRAYFTVSGSGKLVENMGTYNGSSVIEFANGRAAIEFRPVPFERSVIEVRNQDFKGSYIQISM